MKTNERRFCFWLVETSDLSANVWTTVMDDTTREEAVESFFYYIDSLSTYDRDHQCFALYWAPVGLDEDGCETEPDLLVDGSELIEIRAGKKWRHG